MFDDYLFDDDMIMESYEEFDMLFEGKIEGYKDAVEIRKKLNEDIREYNHIKSTIKSLKHRNGSTEEIREKERELRKIEHDIKEYRTALDRAINMEKINKGQTAKRHGVDGGIEADKNIVKKGKYLHPESKEEIKKMTESSLLEMLLENPPF